MDLVSGLNIYCIVFMHESDAKVKYSDIRIYIYIYVTKMSIQLFLSNINSIRSQVFSRINNFRITHIQ